MKQIIYLFLLCPFLIISQTSAQKRPNHLYPDLFRFKIEERSIWKLDLLNAVRDLNKTGFSGFFNVGFEQKLGTALSIDATIGAWYQFRFSPAKASAIFSLPDGSVSLTIEPRFYYNMNKRIRTFKGANNLSANYIGLQGITQLLFLRRDPQIVGGKGVYFFHGFTAAPVYGLQRRIGKRGFFDFSLGLRFFSGKYAQRGFVIRTPDEVRWKPSPITKLRMGIAF